MVGSLQGLWFANPGGSNSIPSRTHSSVQRTRSLPVHTTPQTMVMFQQSGKKGHRGSLSLITPTFISHRHITQRVQCLQGAALSLLF